MAGQDICIIEYHNGKPMHQYDGLQECASNFHCHTELIKGLIYTGQAFPYLEENITFDFAPQCKYDVKRREQTSSRSASTRYYLFDVVRTDDKPRRRRKNIDIEGEERKWEKEEEDLT